MLSETLKSYITGGGKWPAPSELSLCVHRSARTLGVEARPVQRGLPPCHMSNSFNRFFDQGDECLLSESRVHDTD